jgi:hypothetical protein
MGDDIPFEVCYEQAKLEIRNLVGKVGLKYKIPVPLLNIILSDLAKDSRISTLEAIAMSSYSFDGSHSASPKQPENADTTAEKSKAVVDK